MKTTFRLKKSIISHLQNLPGWRTHRKIVVIESDDWGSIRMPSREVYYKLLSEGYKVDQNPFMKYDCLASEKDLSLLFEVLSSIKDKNGREAVITANTIMANPDFDKIRKSDFAEYFYEPFTDTLSRYPEHTRSFDLWKEGISAGVFHPQYHGREHLNVARWMKALREGNKTVTHAFNNRMLSIRSEPSEMRFGYLEALDYFSKEEQLEKSDILKEGMSLFNEIFGFTSRSFIANCYVWDKEAEKTLEKIGVEYIQGIVQQLIPENKDNRHFFKKAYHYIGEKNSRNQTYIVRNAYFEPSLQGDGINPVDYCILRVGAAFRMGKPAIIESHRINFIGSIHQDNREKNLKLLKRLFEEILRKWPDVEFMTSDELGEYIANSNV